MHYPTQFQLATLAANYTGTGSPQERVTAALLIWKVAGETLEAAARRGEGNEMRAEPTEAKIAKADVEKSRRL